MAGTKAITRLGSGVMSLTDLWWLLNLVQGLIDLWRLLDLMQGIEGSINTMNLHGLTSANAMLQAVSGAESNGILLEANVKVMLLEPW